MVVCVFLPRFSLSVAAGGREALVAGPVALAPEVGREPLVGESSAAAEAYGIRAGMLLGEALARCPTLRLVPPDPAGVADAWERVVGRLEGIGAAVEAGRPGVAWFEARGLRRLHDGEQGVIVATRQALGRAGWLGVAPSRFAAVAAAGRARSRRPEVAPAGTARLAAYLAPLPTRLLALRADTAEGERDDPPGVLGLATLPETLERFGVRTLGELAALPRAALADRFGASGLLARELARGWDTPLRPRLPSERLEEGFALPESASGPQLERALGLLIDRVLARRERRGRTMRAAVLSATLVEGGTWRVRVTFREALADRRRMLLVLAPRLADIPAPAETLRLRAEGLGPPAADQRSLLDESAAIRAARLREAVRQARSVAGPDAALRILAVDPESRVPERRLALTPWEP